MINSAVRITVHSKLPSYLSPTAPDITAPKKTPPIKIVPMRGTRGASSQTRFH